MFSSFGVVLDACVLVPITLCDVLLSAADRRIYRPLWTATILDETERALARLGVESDKARYRRSTIEEMFPEALIESYEPLIPGMQNDEKDRHVLAAAVRACSEMIVTNNVRDFPTTVLDPLGIEAIPADQFLNDLLAFDEDEVLAAIDSMVAAKRRPPLTRLELLQRVGRNAPNFAAAALICFESKDASSS